MTDAASPVSVTRGDGPVILGMPHTGIFVPDDIKARLNAEGQLLRDTDWHVDRLYDGLLASATIVRATFHRYVIDANRDPAGVSLYPGQNTTELVPTTNFDGAPIWVTGAEPDGGDIAARTMRYHTVYHQALSAEIARVKAQSGVAILYDCHSIRSQIPHLFSGALPDMNIGTNDGATCSPILSEIVRSIAAASPYSHVVNGRFKGGWTTRHYGRPGTRVHAIQMELVQGNYLASEAPPFEYDRARAERLRGVLRDILGGLEDAAPALRGAVRAQS